MVAETMTPEGQYALFKHEFDRGRAPELYWLGKYKNDDEETQSPDLRVDTGCISYHHWPMMYLLFMHHRILIDYQ